MNDRIKELMAQAKAEIRSEEEIEGVAYDDFDGQVMEKLAELIVQECLLKVNGAKIRNESYAELIERIKEDFRS